VSTITPANKWYGFKWIRMALRLAIYARDNYECVYCGARDNLTLDHLRPRSKSGSNKPSNLVTACVSCNASRGDKPWRQFASERAIERVQRQRRRGVTIRRKQAKAHLHKHDSAWKQALRDAIDNGM